MTDLRRKVHNLLDAPASRERGSWVSDFLLILILLNVFAILLESVDWIHDRWLEEFAVFELLSVAVFSVEYLLRIWACPEEASGKYVGLKGRLRFLFTPMSIIDLLAVLPFYLAFVVPVYDLRFLRVLRVLRMLKLVRYSRSMDMMKAVLGQERRALGAAVIVMLVVLVLASSLMYLIEETAQPVAFSNIPAAMWWGMATLTTVGYGDVVPVTAWGKALGIVISLAGVGTFALPAGIIVSGFIDQVKKRDFLTSWHAVASLPIFQTLNATQVSEIVEKLQHRTVERNEMVFEKDDIATGMYFITSGQLEVELPGGEKKRLSSGSFVGEIGLMKKTTRTATVTATTRSILLFLERDDFEELMRRHPQMRAAVESKADNRLAELESLAQSSPES